MGDRGREFSFFWDIYVTKKLASSRVGSLETNRAATDDAIMLNARGQKKVLQITLSKRFSSPNWGSKVGKWHQLGSN